MLRKLPLRYPRVVAAALVMALPVAAQEEPAVEEAPAAVAPAATAPAATGFQADVVADLERTGARLIALAEAIPADQYGWRPAEGVRSVSEVLVHVATANEMLPTGMGAAPPDYVELPQTMDMSGVMAWMREREATTTAKDDAIAALRRSIDHATAAVRGFDAASLDEPLDFLGLPASRRAYVLILLTHNHEHLGQAIAYARSLGVTPPWSAAPPAAEEAEAADTY